MGDSDLSIIEIRMTMAASAAKNSQEKVQKNNADRGLIDEIDIVEERGIVENSQKKLIHNLKMVKVV